MQEKLEMVFCYPNCSDLLCEKIPGGFSYVINSNSNGKKLLRFRNMQEKLEKYYLVLRQCFRLASDI